MLTLMKFSVIVAKVELFEELTNKCTEIDSVKYAITWTLLLSINQRMFTVLVFAELFLPSRLIITLVAEIFHTFMDRLAMSLKTVLSCCLIFTLVTGIFDTFMDSLLMLLKTALLCCPIFTLVTGIFDTFMDR